MTSDKYRDAMRCLDEAKEETLTVARSAKVLLEAKGSRIRELETENVRLLVLCNGREMQLQKLTKRLKDLIKIVEEYES